MIIPHGSTILRAGDVLVVVNHGQITAEFDALCNRQPNATIQGGRKRLAYSPKEQHGRPRILV